MRIITCVKHVPDATDPVDFDTDRRLSRPADTSRLSELDEYAVEQSLQLRAAYPDATVTALTVGPEAAGEALKRALQMGADDAILVSDPAIAGSDVFGTVAVLAAAIRAQGEVDLVVCGMTSTDAGTGVLPALLADALGRPLLSYAAEVTPSDAGLVITRIDETGMRTVQASLPAVLSVTDQTGEARYPSFKDVLAAKKKPVMTVTLADLGLAPDLVGAGAARVSVLSVVRNPERPPGRVIVDVDGSSVDDILDFLATTTQIGA